MDLKEKINQPFFSRNNEITKFLIDGVKSGVLTAYTNDSVSTVLTSEGFAKNMLMEETGGLSFIKVKATDIIHILIYLDLMKRRKLITPAKECQFFSRENTRTL